MTFDAQEKSLEGGSRVELYSLAIGSDIYRMHDSIENELTYSSDTYFKASVSRGRIVTGQEHLTITLPGDHDFSSQFTTIAPGQLGTLTIFSYHRADPSDVKVIYKGVVRSVAFTQDMAKSMLAVVPVSEAFDKEIPQRTFQASCNNVLFDADCKVTASSYQHTDTITAVSGNTITVQGLQTAKGNGWATGGYVANGSLDYRLILEQNGDVCTLTLPFYANVLGKTLDVYAGCARDIGTCNTKFSNQINFGGCPYVPSKNIFMTGL